MRGVLDGLVLRETEVGESDKLLTVLTAKEGPVLMTAKGARSMKSKFLPLCRLFTYGNFEYYEKNGRRWLAGGSVNDNFYGLNSDMEGFALASYVVQVANEITGEGVEAEDVLRMTLNTLYAIEKKLKPYWQIKATYELFAVITSGMSPDLSGCSVCGESLPPHGWLDVMNGCVICDGCLKKRQAGLPLPEEDALRTRNILCPVDSSALAAMRYVEGAPLARAFAFGLSDRDSMRLFGTAAETFLLHHLERDFETLRFYHSVKESSI